MNDIKKKFENGTLNDITLYQKQCPKCNVSINYKNKYNLQRSVENNLLCVKCCKIGKSAHNRKYDRYDLTRKCPNCGIEVHYSSRSSKNRALRCNAVCKYGCSNRKYPHRYEKVSQSMREFKLSISGKQNFNTKGCLYLDDLNKTNGWSLRHALNGGEVRVIGYSLDGYDQSRNIVVEYDERHHYDSYGNLKQDDARRQERIINHLNCKFFRYNERRDELYEVTKTV
jgi:hypothetical protein